MSLSMLTQKSFSLFAALGGWRTVAEGVASRALFLVAYLLTGQVVTSALVAVGGVAVFTVMRVLANRKYWQAALGLGIVGVSALLAGSTGHAVAFYLPAVLMQVGGGTVFLLSMLVRWPVIGLVVGRHAVDGLTGVKILYGDGVIRCARRFSWPSTASPRRCWYRYTLPGRWPHSASPRHSWGVRPQWASASICAGAYCAPTGT